MTVKRYFDEPLILEFEATVSQAIPQDDGTFHIMLEETYFYPTGGGQAHDIGTIATVTVLDVMKDGETIVHVTNSDVPQGACRAVIDKTRRWGNLQAHTGQHLLSATFVHELDADTVSVKMSADGISTVDITLSNLTPEQIEQVEQSANRVILENRDVKSCFVTPENVPQEKMRRPLPVDKITGDIRIVEIVDWDTSACAGTHLPNTGMIGLLKILKVENYKGGSRVYFVTGYNALKVFNQYQNVIDTLGNQLSTGVDDLIENIEKLSTERNELSKTVASQHQQLMQYEAQELLKNMETVGDNAIIFATFDNRLANDLKLLANALTEQANAVVVLLNQQGKDSELIIATSHETGIHAGNMIKSIFAELSGRGGGSNIYAQGIMPNIIIDEKMRSFIHDAIKNG